MRILKAKKDQQGSMRCDPKIIQVLSPHVDIKKATRIWWWRCIIEKGFFSFHRMGFVWMMMRFFLRGQMNWKSKNEILGINFFSLSGIKDFSISFDWYFHISHDVPRDPFNLFLLFLPHHRTCTLIDMWIYLQTATFQSDIALCAVCKNPSESI